jgi:hypothetical protein
MNVLTRKQDTFFFGREEASAVLPFGNKFIKFCNLEIRTLNESTALTCFIDQYLTENSKNWVSISCFHVKITDVRIETFKKVIYRYSTNHVYTLIIGVLV